MIIRNKFSSSSLIIFIILFLLLPSLSIILSIIFQKNLNIDQPKIVEESLKGILSLIITIAGVFLSDVLVSREQKLKNKVFLSQIENYINSIHEKSKLLDDCSIYKGIDDLSTHSADDIRKLTHEKKEISRIIQEINEFSTKTINIFSQFDSSAVYDCSRIHLSLIKITSSSNNFLTNQTNENFQRFRADLSVLKYHKK